MKLSVANPTPKDYSGAHVCLDWDEEEDDTIPSSPETLPYPLPEPTKESYFAPFASLR